MTTPFRPNYIPDTQIAPLFASSLFSLATLGNLDGHNYILLIETVRRKERLAIGRKMKYFLLLLRLKVGSIYEK